MSVADYGLDIFLYCFLSIEPESIAPIAIKDAESTAQLTFGSTPKKSWLAILIIHNVMPKYTIPNAIAVIDEMSVINIA